MAACCTGTAAAAAATGDETVAAVPAAAREFRDCFNANLHPKASLCDGWPALVERHDTTALLFAAVTAATHQRLSVNHWCNVGRINAHAQHQLAEEDQHQATAMTKLTA
jgi:hypothetical protein